MTGVYFATYLPTQLKVPAVLALLRPRSALDPFSFTCWRLASLLALGAVAGFETRQIRRREIKPSMYIRPARLDLNAFPCHACSGGQLRLHRHLPEEASEVSLIC